MRHQRTVIEASACLQVKRGAATSVYVATAKDFQLNLGTELIQGPELLFQPPIVGLDQCG